MGENRMEDSALSNQIRICFTVDMHFWIAENVLSY